MSFVYKYGGLCELICNRVLIDNSLGKYNYLNSLKDRITLERLDNEQITTSHLLDVYSIFHTSMAFLLGTYPDNIFSTFDQWKLVKEERVNRKILENGLKHIESGETLKLEVIRKEGLSGFVGHSLLMKKISDDDYIFFDPNSGEHRGLSLKEVGDRIDEQLKMWSGTDIFIMKGDLYLKKLATNFSAYKA